MSENGMKAGFSFFAMGFHGLDLDLTTKNNVWIETLWDPLRFNNHGWPEIGGILRQRLIALGFPQSQFSMALKLSRNYKIAGPGLNWAFVV